MGMVVGTVILLVGYTAWGIGLYLHRLPGVADYLILFLPMIAGFASSWLTARNALAPGIILAIPAACFAVMVNVGLQLAGYDVGFTAGVAGAFRLAVQALLTAGLFSAIGGLLAVVLRRATGTT